MVSSSRMKLSLGDIPDTLGFIEGEITNELSAWLNTDIVIAIQQLKEASHGTSHGVDNVQILLNVIEECKLQLAAVPRQEEEKMQRRAALGDRERGMNQWYEFRKQAWVDLL